MCIVINSYQLLLFSFCKYNVHTSFHLIYMQRTNVFDVENNNL